VTISRDGDDRRPKTYGDALPYADALDAAKPHGRSDDLPSFDLVIARGMSGDVNFAFRIVACRRSRKCQGRGTDNEAFMMRRRARQGNTKVS
jgi:hypothetical protein